MNKSNKTKTKKEYADMIVTALGGTIVDIEIEDDLDKILDIAFLKIKPRIGTSKYMTVPISDTIDLRNKNVYTVINVYRTSPVTNGYGNSSSSSSMYTDAILFNPSMLLTGISGYNNTLNRSLGITASDNVAISLLTSQVINQASGRSSDIDFEYDDGYLYVETAGAGTETVTIEYIPNYNSVEDVDEPFWQMYIFEMGLAYAKIALGRARNKHRVSNVQYELDGDTLISEGTSELEQLTEKLEESNDLDYFLD